MFIAMKIKEEETKMETSSEKKGKESFEWSLRPLFVFSLFCGIRLDISERRQRLIYSMIILLLGVPLVVFNLFFNGVTFWKTFAKHAVYGKIPKEGKKEDVPNILNSLVGIFIYTGLPIGTHVIFICMLFGKIFLKFKVK